MRITPSEIQHARSIAGERIPPDQTCRVHSEAWGDLITRTRITITAVNKNEAQPKQDTLGHSKRRPKPWRKASQPPRRLAARRRALTNGRYAIIADWPFHAAQGTGDGTIAHARWRCIAPKDASGAIGKGSNIASPRKSFAPFEERGKHLRSRVMDNSSQKRFVRTGCAPFFMRLRRNRRQAKGPPRRRPMGRRETDQQPITYHLPWAKKK